MSQPGERSHSVLWWPGTKTKFIVSPFVVFTVIDPTQPQCTSIFWGGISILCYLILLPFT